MIYTVTLNPAVDYILHLNRIEQGKINRTEKEEYRFGGKGINVSVVLNNLKIDNIALGFRAGFTGEFIIEQLEKAGIRNDFVMLDTGMTRINVKIKTDDETDLNGNGPDISIKDIDNLVSKLKVIKPGDFLVLSGTVPKNAPDTVYSDILAKIDTKDVKVICDTTGDYLKNVLKHEPFLVKPNVKELSELSGRDLITDNDIISGAKKLQQAGAKNVLVSIGPEGAILVTEHEIYCKDAPKGTVKNTVGAGDAMAAGFIAGYLKNNDFEYALKYGLAAGSATAFSDTLAGYDEIQALLDLNFQ